MHTFFELTNFYQIGYIRIKQKNYLLFEHKLV